MLPHLDPYQVCEYWNAEAIFSVQLDVEVYATFTHPVSPLVYLYAIAEGVCLQNPYMRVCRTSSKLSCSGSKIG